MRARGNNISGLESPIVGLQAIAVGTLNTKYQAVDFPQVSTSQQARSQGGVKGVCTPPPFQGPN